MNKIIRPNPSMNLDEIVRIFEEEGFSLKDHPPNSVILLNGSKQINAETGCYIQIYGGYILIVFHSNNTDKEAYVFRTAFRINNSCLDVFLDSVSNFLEITFRIHCLPAAKETDYYNMNKDEFLKIPTSFSMSKEIEDDVLYFQIADEVGIIGNCVITKDQAIFNFERKLNEYFLLTELENLRYADDEEVSKFEERVNAIVS